MQNRKFQLPAYSLLQEDISLDSQFPLFQFFYSISRDQICNLHSHNVLELGFCIHGSGIFIIDNKITTYETGDIIAIGPGIYHRAKSSVGKDDLWWFLYFHPEDWDVPVRFSDIRMLINKAEDPYLPTLIHLLMDEISNKNSNYISMVQGLIVAISIRLSRLFEHHIQISFKSTSSKIEGIDERIMKAMDMLISSESFDLSIAELAESCCLSASHFRRLFKRQVGMSPKHFQTKLKVKMAMNLLRDKQMKILDIALESGFQSLSSFNRQFKLETGLSPLQWANQYLMQSKQ